MGVGLFDAKRIIKRAQKGKIQGKSRGARSRKVIITPSHLHSFDSKITVAILLT